MASSKSQALLCDICGKATGNFTCRGCNKDFCANHVTEHRQILSNKLDEIVLEHDQLKESLTQDTGRSRHDLMKEIDKWEEESHEIIGRIASRCRKQLSNVDDRFKNKINERLDSIAQELRKFREDDTFVETDLNAWTTKLENLKTEVIVPPIVSIRRDDYDIPFLTRPLVIETSDDVFEESNGNVIIGDNSRVITHGFWSSYGAVRGKGEYSSGCYQFHFKIEAFSGTSVKGLSVGIISKVTQMKKSSFEDTSCGWVGSNCVRHANCGEFGLVVVGGRQSNKEQNGEHTFFKFQQNDIFELLVNCNREKIRLTNEQTDEIEEIEVDVHKFPFPWQLNCSVSDWNQRIRLLTTSDIIDTNNK
jgi:hypothetical protein